MLKNDFRRSLILLRPLRRGMSGHVRLERRTLQGSMRFTVQGGAGRLHALLLAQTPQGWTVCKLGALAADSRGQAGLIATFDPRNLEGLDLNQYALVALVTDGSAPEMVMSGMVNGSREIDWAGAEAAATAPYRRAEQAPKTREAEVSPACCCDVPETAASEPLPQATEPEDTATEDTTVKDTTTEDTTTEDTTVEDTAAEDTTAEDTTAEDTVSDVMASEDAIAREDTAPEEDSATAETPPAACVLLALDMALAWPEEIAALKPLFERNPKTGAFALEDFVFVEAPLPSEEGTGGTCAIGLRARDGAPVSVCYALAGDYAPEPPPGLEGYQYLGGWWYTVLEVQPEINALGETIA